MSGDAPAAGPPGYPVHYPPRPEGRPVSFYVAIFLGLLLLVSGALNVLLLLFSALGSAAGYGGDTIEADGAYRLVAVAGDADARASILRIPIHGVITEGPAPLIGGLGGAVSAVRRALRAARRNDSIRGILLDIDSPGGGVTESDEIHRMITEFRRKRHVPVVALLGDMAASGGYYVAAACDEIIARPTTITGSIGVILSSYNYGEAMKKIGIEEVAIKSRDTPFKDMMSPSRPMRPEERAKLEAIVQEMYERFVDVVDRGRPSLTRDQVKRLATGEIYSAKQARENGLVDAIGSAADARARLRERIGPKVTSVRVLENRRRPTLAEILLGVRAPRVSMDSVVARLLAASTGPRLMYYWRGGR